MLPPPSKQFVNETLQCMHDVCGPPRTGAAANIIDEDAIAHTQSELDVCWVKFVTIQLSIILTWKQKEILRF
jgi:hypothetical protein